MNRIRLIGRVLIAGLVMLAAWPALAQDKVMVGVFPVSSALPYFVALERGLFKACRRPRSRRRRATSRARSWMSAASR